MDTEVKELVEAAVAEPTQQDTGTSEKQETPEEINWKKFREARERDRQEVLARKKREADLEEQNRAMKALVESVVSKQPNLSNAEKKDIVASIPLGEFTTGEDVVKFVESKLSTDVTQKLEELLERRERAREAEKRKKEAEEMPKRLREEIRDFDKVCNTENLDYFEYHHPEAARSLELLPDGIEKWKMVYAAVKRYVPNIDSNRERARVEANLSKPKSVSAMPQGSRDEAPKILDADTKRANWERMQRQMKGIY
jgi:hypothetical protein